MSIWEAFLIPGLKVDISKSSAHLTVFGSDRVLSCESADFKAKPLMKAKRVQVLTIQHPLSALRDAKEPFLVIYVYCKLIDLVPQFCNQHPQMRARRYKRLRSRAMRRDWQNGKEHQ